MFESIIKTRFSFLLNYTSIPPIKYPLGLEALNGLSEEERQTKMWEHLRECRECLVKDTENKTEPEPEHSISIDVEKFIMDNGEFFKITSPLLNTILNVKLCELPQLAEFFLAGASIVLISHCSFITYNKIYKKVLIQFSVAYLCISILFSTLLLMLNDSNSYINTRYLTFDFMFFNSFLGTFAKFITILISFLCIYLIQDYLFEKKINNTEYDLLTMYSIIGLILLINADDLISIFLALEVQALAFYVMSGFKKNSVHSVESGLKYFFIGSLSTAYFLLGCNFLYGATGLLALSSFHILSFNASKFLSESVEESLSSKLNVNVNNNKTIEEQELKLTLTQELIRLDQKDETLFNNNENIKKVMLDEENIKKSSSLKKLLTNLLEQKMLLKPEHKNLNAFFILDEKETPDLINSNSIEQCLLTESFKLITYITLSINNENNLQKPDGFFDNGYYTQQNSILQLFRSITCINNNNSKDFSFHQKLINVYDKRDVILRIEDVKKIKCNFCREFLLTFFAKDADPTAEIYVQRSKLVASNKDLNSLLTEYTHRPIIKVDEDEFSSKIKPSLESIVNDQKKPQCWLCDNVLEKLRYDLEDNKDQHEILKKKIFDNYKSRLPKELGNIYDKEMNDYIKFRKYDPSKKIMEEKIFYAYLDSCYEADSEEYRIATCEQIIKGLEPAWEVNTLRNDFFVHQLKKTCEKVDRNFSNSTNKNNELCEFIKKVLIIQIDKPDTINKIFISLNAKERFNCISVVLQQEISVSSQILYIQEQLKLNEMTNKTINFNINFFYFNPVKQTENENEYNLKNRSVIITFFKELTCKVGNNKKNQIKDLGLRFYYNPIINFYQLYDSRRTNNNISKITEGSLLLVLMSFFLKLAIAPLHLMTLDVYEGSPTSSTLLFALISKFSIIIIILKIYYYGFYHLSKNVLSQFIIAGSILSVFFGSLAGTSERKLKSLLAYSSITNTGYLVLAMGVNTLNSVKIVLFYLAIYLSSSLAAWSGLVSIQIIKTRYMKKNNKEFADLVLLKKTNPILTLLLLSILFSTAGLPPFIGFLTKTELFLVSVESDLFLVSSITLLFSVISSFYYLRLVKVMCFEKLLIGELYKTIKLKQSFVNCLFGFFLIYLYVKPWIPVLFSYKMIVN